MPTDCRLTVIAKSFIECVNGASNYKIEKKDEKKNRCLERDSQFY